MITKRVLFICCLVFFTACDGNSVPGNDWGDAVPLTVQELTLTEEASSRVAAGTVTTDGAAIGVFQLAFNGYMPSYNCPYTYSAADGGWTTATPLFVDMRKAKIVGVYDPHNVGAFPASNTGTVSSTKLTAQAYDETKVRYFDNSHNTEVNCFVPSVAFTMKPVYSRIQLSIQRHAANYIGNCAITSVNLKSGTAFYSDNALDVSTGSLQGSATAGGWTYNPSIASIAAGGTNTAYDVLVPPQAVTSGLTVTLTVDGTVRAITIPASKFTSNALAAGQQYTIELLMIDTGVSFASVSKTDMGATPANPNIKFEPEID